MAERQAAIGARPPPAGDPDTVGREDERAGLIGRLLAFVAHRRFEPGDRLPSERELAERFGVGRNAVREAVAVLETLRMVERRPNSGIYLREVGRQGSLDAMVLQADLGVPLTEAEVAEVVELRRILELQAIRLACERRRDADIERLDRVLAAGEATIAAGGNLADRDAEFHLAVVEATGNHVLLRVVNSFYLLSRDPPAALLRRRDAGADLAGPARGDARRHRRPRRAARGRADGPAPARRRELLARAAAAAAGPRLAPPIPDREEERT